MQLKIVVTQLRLSGASEEYPIEREGGPRRLIARYRNLKLNYYFIEFCSGS